MVGEILNLLVEVDNVPGIVTAETMQAVPVPALWVSGYPCSAWPAAASAEGANPAFFPVHLAGGLIGNPWHNLPPASADLLLCVFSVHRILSPLGWGCCAAAGSRVTMGTLWHCSCSCVRRLPFL